MVDFKTAAKGPAVVDGVMKIVLFVCSILFPGLTQVAYGIFNNCDCSYVMVGILMLILSPFLVGFIWSIVWGVFALKGGSAPAAAADPETPVAPEPAAAA